MIEQNVPPWLRQKNGANLQNAVQWESPVMQQNTPYNPQAGQYGNSPPYAGSPGVSPQQGQPQMQQFGAQGQVQQPQMQGTPQQWQNPPMQQPVQAPPYYGNVPYGQQQQMRPPMQQGYPMQPQMPMQQYPPQYPMQPQPGQQKKPITSKKKKLLYVLMGLFICATLAAIGTAIYFFSHY